MEEQGARRFSLFWPRPLFEDLGVKDRGQESAGAGRMS